MLIPSRAKLPVAILVAGVVASGCGTDSSESTNASGGAPSGFSGGTPGGGGTTSAGPLGGAGIAAGMGGGTLPSSSGGLTGSGGVIGSGGAPAGSGGATSGASGFGGTVSAGGQGGNGGSNTGATGGGGSTGAAGAGATAGMNGSGGSATCPSPALTSGDTNKTIQVGSDSRTYILHVPSKYMGDKAVPLVVDFHPLGGSGAQEEGSSPYKALTDAEGVISAYPNGKAGPSGGAWNVGPCCVANVDDVAFARALVADVEKIACIDTKRVYAVGFSMGGGMSHYVACHAADLFAAVAPASFDLVQKNEAGCTPSRPIAEISFRSSNDPIVPYGGGASSVVPGMPVTFLGAVGTFQKWAQIDTCTGMPTATDNNNCQFYTSCGDGVQVGLCTMSSGHAPGNASVGWPFLKRYTLP